MHIRRKKAWILSYSIAVDHLRRHSNGEQTDASWTICRSHQSVLLERVSDLFASRGKHSWRNKCNASAIFHTEEPSLHNCLLQARERGPCHQNFIAKKTTFQSHAYNLSVFSAAASVLPIFFLQLCLQTRLNRSRSIFMPQAWLSVFTSDWVRCWTK